MTGSAGRPVEIGELVGRLAAAIEPLCRDLLPAGVRCGSEWCVAAAGSPTGCSISVHLAGGKAGVWGAWATGTGGDALDLVATVADLSRFRSEHDGGDKAAAIRWARAWLGIDGELIRNLRNSRSTAAPAPVRQAEPNAEQKRESAWRLWLAASPLRPGDEGWDYLTGTRGIDLAALPRLPGALRYMRGLTNAEAGRRFPAIVAAVIGPGGRFQTIHRTWLERQSDGRVLKAPVAEPKKVYGPCKGGLIRLARGASGRPWKEAPIGDILGLSEGIENALSYALAVPEHRVAAALNVGNLLHVKLPPTIDIIVIAADSDAPGSPAARTLQRAVDRFLAEHRDVRIARCPAGVKDLNELLLAEAG